MPTPEEKRQKRWYAGHLAKQRGDLWEAQFERACRRVGILPIRMPNGCRRYGRKGLVQIPTPFDYMAIWQGVSAYFDVKNYSGDTLKYSQLVPHQVASLSNIEEAGAVAGYLVQFHELNRVVFYSAKVLQHMVPRVTLTVDDGIDLGPLEELNMRRLFSHGTIGQRTTVSGGND